MNKKHFILLQVVCMILFLVACHTTQKQSSKQNTQPNDERKVNEVDFSVFNNVEITGLSKISSEEQEVLFQQARYCQAMTEGDTETMREIVSPDMIFTHMSGRQQTRDQYFADIEEDHLQYYTIGIKNPVIHMNGDYASITYTSILNANAYGAQGTYRIKGTHWYKKHNENWIACNAPQ